MENFELWLYDNFRIVFNYGNSGLQYDPQELILAKRLIKPNDELESLPQQDRIFLFQALAVLIHNVKGEIQLLSDKKTKGYARTLETMQRIVMRKENIHKITFYSKGKESKEEKYIISDPNVIASLITGLIRSYPILHEANAIVDKLKKVEGKTGGIPNLVYGLSLGVDAWIKKLLPGFSTNTIIRDILFEVGLEAYADINNIDNYIKRGKLSK